MLPNSFAQKLVNRLLLILLTLALSACGAKPQDQILGKWQEVSGDRGVMEFFQDGTFIGGAKKQNVQGKWIILNDGRLKLDVNVLGMATQTSLLKIRFDGGDLFISDETGKEENRLKRIK